MAAKYRAEIIKLWGTPTSWWLAALAVVIVVVPMVLTLTFTHIRSAADTRSLLSFAGTAGLAMLVLGIVAAAGEYRHHTIVATALISPRRVDALVAQVAAYATAGLAVGLVSALLTAAITLPWLASKNPSTGVSAAALATLFVGTIAYTALSAAIGVGLGALVRNQVAAVAILMLYLSIGGYIVAIALPDISKFDPSAIGIAMSGGTQGIGGPSSPLLSIGSAYIAYLAYAAALLGIALILLPRRELR